MTIRQLPDPVINQIAAGEVVERPASVVKELVENALDAGATQIDVTASGGGLSLLRVSDNGGGIAPDELELAISRHCTSKLNGAIDDIQWLGFRGEALPSIGSVARLTVTSRKAGHDAGAAITVTGGHSGGVFPAAMNRGTIVEVRDLFFNVPARLKFLRSPQAEASAISDIIRRIALARPDVHFSFGGEQTGLVDLPASTQDDALLRRVRQIFGADFADSALEIDGERENVRLYGYTSPPSYNRANSRMQYVFVNGRAIRDRQILGAIAGAYSDRLPRGRYAGAALFIEVPPHLVDVNVHPAKAEVRFRDSGLVRGLIVGSLRDALDRQGLTANRAATRNFAALARPGSVVNSFMMNSLQSPQIPVRPALQMPLEDSSRDPNIEHFAHEEPEPYQAFVPSSRSAPESSPVTAGRLGAARAQLHRNYIIAQTHDGIVLVDQHAAHERLVFEALKRGLESHGAASQMLLMPEIVALPQADAMRVLQYADTLSKFGLLIEGFGDGAIAVNGTPSMLGDVDSRQLILDLADELADSGQSRALQNRIDAIASRIACHGSVRSGREMRVEEMNALLREMEATPGSDTCNHGRPTFVELKLTDIERLFERR
jgi:DNA mismatch repair protein MutL